MDISTEQQPITFARTKTLRFKLSPESEYCERLIQKMNVINEEDVDLAQFVNHLDMFLNHAESHLFKDEKFKQGVEYKYHFIKTYFKREYYAHLVAKQKKSYDLSKESITFYEELNRCINNLREIKENISHFAYKQSEEKESLMRREVMANCAKQLARKDSFELLFACLDNLPSKLRNEQLIIDGKKLQTQIDLITENYLDSHSEGRVITKASFNYFTINKSPKMLDEKLKRLINLDVDKDLTLTIDSIKNKIKTINYFVIEKTDFKPVLDKVSSGICTEKSLDHRTWNPKIKEKLTDNIEVLNVLNIQLKNTKAFCKQALYELASQQVDYETVKLLTVEHYFSTYKNKLDRENDRIYWNQLRESLSELQQSTPFQHLNEDSFNQLKKDSLSLNEINEKLKTAQGEHKKGLKNQLTDLKEKRGLIFKRTDKNKDKNKDKDKDKNKDKENKLDKTFEGLCKLHQSIAIQYGQLKAKKTAIEKEKVESNLLKYWSVITKTTVNKKGKQKENYHLVLIPQEKRNSFKKYLNQNSENDQRSKNCIYYFESLTYKALAKLCFNYATTGQRDELNEFWKGVSSEFKQSGDEVLENFAQFNRFTVPKKIYAEAQNPKDEQECIAFFKAVLKTNYAQRVLSFPPNIKSIFDFDEKRGLDLFEQELNKISYQRIIKKEIKRPVLSKEYDAQIFKIDSFDLQKESRNYKEHSQLWFDFWHQEPLNNFPLRLNPEMSIAYRKPKKAHTYGKETERYNGNWRNRHRDEQYVLRTTFTENAFAKQYDLSFDNKATIKEKIKSFNDSLQRTQYTMGIDLGERERATLTLAIRTGQEKPSALPQEFEVYQIKEDRLNYQQTTTIKYKENGVEKTKEKPFYLIQNLSYFTNKDLYEKTFNINGAKIKKFDVLFEELFEKTHISSLDLTMAKVINNKIFINGDIQTVFNLEILKLKQKLVKEQHNKNKISIKTLKKEKFEVLHFCIDGQEKSFAKFNYRGEFNALPIVQDWQFPETYKMAGLKLSAQEKPQSVFQYIKQYMECYIESELKNNHNPTLEKINLYRQGMVANMVGVVNKIESNYPSTIAFENFDINVNNNALKKDESTIYNVIVDKVIQKFYNLGKVPPLKALYDLKAVTTQPDNKEGKYVQFGHVLFVNEEETSTLCPKCGKKTYITGETKVNIKDENGKNIKDENGKNIKDENGVKKQEITKYDKDKKNHIFVCSQKENGTVGLKYKNTDKGYGNCGFHNHNNPFGFASLDDNDKVAAFNIAKRAITVLDNQANKIKKQKAKQTKTPEPPKPKRTKDGTLFNDFTFK